MNAKIACTSLFTAVLCGAIVFVDAHAASIRIDCERRADRSKISVDGANLPPGLFRCIARSGSNARATPLRAQVRGERECDFDSNPNDVAAGATRIPFNFIQGGQVIGKIVNGYGFTVISDTAACRIR
jgi:hypothetical protein